MALQHWVCFAKASFAANGSDSLLSSWSWTAVVVAASDRASGDGSATLTGLTVSGDATTTNGATVSYSSAVTGTDVNTAAGTYLWTVADVAVTIADASAAATDITFNATGTATVTCTYTEGGVTGSPVSDDLTVTVS